MISSVPYISDISFFTAQLLLRESVVSDIIDIDDTSYLTVYYYW
jgi:hypothetical protein